MAIIVYQLEAQFKLKDLLDTLPINTQTYFYWKRKFRNVDPDENLKSLIKEICAQDIHLGVRRVCLILRNQYSLKINHKKVQRLMRVLEIKGQGYSTNKRKYNSYKGPKGQTNKNRINRRFYSDRPWQKLVSDITEFKLPKTGEKVYLEPIMDLYNREILTYEVTAKGPNLVFALSPLKNLINKRPSISYRTTVHTDQGWQYRHKSWRQFLKKNKLIPSMSHKARCLDNACMESFFNKLKVEIKELQEYQSTSELILDIKSWIQYYNEDRIQVRLQGQSPTQYKIKKQVN